MCAFVVLGLVFPYQAKRLAWERLRNDLFCVEWDVKPQPSQSVGGCKLTWSNPKKGWLNVTVKEVFSVASESRNSTALTLVITPLCVKSVKFVCAFVFERCVFMICSSLHSVVVLQASRSVCSLHIVYLRVFSLLVFVNHTVHRH